MSSRAFILAQALQLPRDERAELAQELLASLDGPAEEDVEASWLVEVERRLGDVERGVSEPRPWEDVHEGIVARIKALPTSGSPLDVPGIDLGLRAKDIVSVVHEGRRF